MRFFRTIIRSLIVILIVTYFYLFIHLGMDIKQSAYLFIATVISSLFLVYISRTGRFPLLDLQKKLKASSEVESALKRSSVGLWAVHVGVDESMLLFSETCDQFFPLVKKKGLIQKDVKAYIKEHVQEEFQNEVYLSLFKLKKGEIQTMDIEYKVKSSTNDVDRWVRHTGNVVDYGADGSPKVISGSILDITQTIEQVKLIEQASYYDELTHLKNRQHLFKKTNDMYSNVSYVVVVDIKEFKVVNELYGTTSGDFCLKEFSSRLSEVFYDEHIYRMNGDEFVVLGSKPLSFTLEDQVKQKCDAFVNVMKKPIVNSMKKEEYPIHVAMGISLNKEKENISILVEIAEIAKAECKKDSHKAYMFADKELIEAYKEKRRLEDDFKRAIEKDEIVSYFQPIVDNTSKEVIGFEALCRWNRFKKQVVSPVHFIDVATRLGMISKVDRIVLDKAIDYYLTLKEKFGLENFMISSNFSKDTIKKLDVDEFYEYVLDKGVEPRNISIEITEDLIMDESIFVKVKELNSLGFSLAIDDFSAGHSSLKYLANLSISKLKLDRSLLPKYNFNLDSNDHKVFRAIVNLANDLNKNIIVEGVEDDIQVEYLKAFNVQSLQGYFFSEPVDSEGFTHLLT